MTLSDIELLRRYTDEPTEEHYGNAFLLDLITTAGGVKAAAAELWSMKASRFAALVDTSEAGASRRMSQAHAQAKSMAAFYGGGDETVGGGASSGYTTTRPIERA